MAWGVGNEPENAGHAASTRDTWVWWSITSETRTSQRSGVERQGRSCRPWLTYHDRSDAGRAIALLADDDRDRSALRQLPAGRALRDDDAARPGCGREVHDH